MSKFPKVIRKLIQDQPEVDMVLIRKTANYIVEDIFSREYNWDNSQTQRAIVEMLQEAGVKTKEEA